METTSINKVFTVSELTIGIKLLLEKNFSYVTLKGEISNLTNHSSGHIYFSLKDENAQISCALFKRNASSLNKIPKDGDQVIIEAQLSVYPPRGSYQLIVRKLNFAGIGELLLRLHELKETLIKRGYFDAKHKKKIPLFPKKIGIITSPTGSVIQDILNVLKRRFKNFHLILNPVKVQGETSKDQIAEAIYDFNRHQLVDVIIIARGGGSLEDLWAFNEEIVAKAIFESKIPIISAIGHETDTTISDFVADVRAPTPSAGAEIVLKEKSLFLDTLKNFEKQILKHVNYQIHYLKTKLKNFLIHPYFSSPYSIIGNQLQALDDIKNSIDLSVSQKLNKQKEILKILSNNAKSLNPTKQIIELKNKIDIFSKRLNLVSKNSLNLHKERLAKLLYHLKTIDPKNLLKKGYSILFKENGCIISSRDAIEDNEKFSVLLSDGKIYAKKEEKNDRR